MAVLDFGRKSVRQSEQSRSQRHHVLMLVLLLGVVVILIDAVRESSNWRWVDLLLFPMQDPPIEHRLITVWTCWPETTRPRIQFACHRRPAVTSADVEGYFPGVRPADFAAVHDDTPSTREEQACSLHLLEILNKTDAKTLREASLGYITYAQLFRQPSQYRGRLVTVSGIVRRVNRIDLFKNDYGIADYYQTWLFPTDNQISPMVIYCLRLPKGFPTGMELAEEAEVTGFFFKRWVYEAKDTVRTAPTLLAQTLQWKKRPVMAPEPPGDTRMTPVAVCVAAVLAMLLAWFVYLRTRPAVHRRPIGRPTSKRWRTGTKNESICRAVLVSPCHHNSCPGRLRSVAESRAEENKKPDNPREMFRALGVDDSYFARLTDGRPLEPNEIESMLRVLYRLRTFPPIDRERWALDAEQARRGDQATGRVAWHDLPPARPGDGRRAVPTGQRRGPTLRTGQVLPLPAATRLARPKRPTSTPRTFPMRGGRARNRTLRPARLGVFLKSRHKENEQTTLAFAAPRLAWYPDNLLGELGMDAGLLDSVQDQKPITAEDREAFYQMLAAVGRAEPGQLLRQAEDDLPNTPRNLAADRSARASSNTPWCRCSTSRQPSVGRLVALTGHRPAGSRRFSSARRMPTSWPDSASTTTTRSRCSPTIRRATR